MSDVPSTSTSGDPSADADDTGTGSQSQPDQQVQAAMTSLAGILGPLPDSVVSSPTPALSLLHNPDVHRNVARRIRLPSSGSGDDALCRWLYDTFYSSDPELQLLVLSFVPTLAGVYLSRAIARKPLPGFEAVLLALYARETASRGGEPVIITIPSSTTRSIYNDRGKPATKNLAVPSSEIGVLSPALEPQGTVRATKRARIVGVALELYYSKISKMPLFSKMEFCAFCMAWTGHAQRNCKKKTEELREESPEKKPEESPEKNPEESQENKPDDSTEKKQDELPEKKPEELSEESTEKKPEKKPEDEEEKGRRIPMPWDLMGPVMRIAGHCVLGDAVTEELKVAGMAVAECLHERAMHDLDERAILASQSLLRLGRMAVDAVWEPPAPEPGPAEGEVGEVEA